MDLCHRGSSSSQLVHHQSTPPLPTGSHALIGHSGISSSFTGRLNSPTVWPTALPMDPRLQIPASSSCFFPSQESSMAITLPRILSAPIPTYTTQATDTSARSGFKEKRHGCQLCDKRFDRPSTLKKHMLVHTGEKAWVCNICGRRFGVSSNLNRHARRCKEKWQRDEVAKRPESVTATSRNPPTSESTASSRSPTSTSLSPGTSTLTSSPASPPTLAPAPTSTSLLVGTVASSERPPTAQKRKHSSDVSDRVPPRTLSTSSNHKRPRRAPSPVQRWVPNSLLSFDLTPITKSAPTPLPPVVPGIYEERNSYDKNASDNPYHRSFWQGRLVGPSYAENSMMINPRGYGKLLVF